MKKIAVLLSVITIVMTVMGCSKKQNEKDFISLAYVSLPMLKLQNAQPEQVKEILDSYRWEGISDVALLGGIFEAGQDGSLVTSWNKEEWPDVFLGLDYKGDSINEQSHRDRLCSRQTITNLVEYFKKKDLRMWLTVKASGWLTGGSLGVVLKDEDLTLKYVDRVCGLARSFGFEGIDFDWEFPPTKAEAEGYRRMMRLCKQRGFKVSVCAIQPTVGSDYLDNCMPEDAGVNAHAGRHMKWEEIISEEMVDQINVMQYLAYNPKTKKMDLKVKEDKMKEWEKYYPQEFSDNKKIDFLTGVGFYSFIIPEKKLPGEGKSANMTKLYEQYGAESYDSPVIGGKHAVWTVTDVRDLVRMAKARGWSGVFTWLVSHDFSKEHPDQYSRQHALGQEVLNIWNEE